MSPVEGVEEVDSRAGRRTSLINPPDEFTANCSTQPDPPGSEEDVQEVTEAFQAVVTG